MIFDILIQLSVINEQAHLIGFLMDLQRYACTLNSGWLTCQMLPVG